MARYVLLLAFLLVTCLNLPFSAGDPSDNDISTLRTFLVSNNYSVARPVKDHSQNITVMFSLSLNHVDMIDNKQEMTVNGWIVMLWMDEFLQWDPKTYGGLDRIHFNEKEIWLPDISVFNSAEGTDIDPYGTVPVLVKSSGLVHWIPPAQIHVKCSMDLTEWPRDSHTCNVIMGSWTHHGKQIDLRFFHNDSKITKENYIENPNWVLLETSGSRKVSHYNSDNDEPYIELIFTLKVQRNAKAKAAYITNCALALMIVVLLSYFLPLHRSLMRLLLHLTSLTLYVVSYVILLASLPSKGGGVPTVVRYFSGSIVLTVFSLMANIGFTLSLGSPMPSSSFGLKIVNFFGTKGGMSPLSCNPMRYNRFEEGEESDSVTHYASPSSASTTAATNNLTATPGTADAEERAHAISSSHKLLCIINALCLLLFVIAFFTDFAMLMSTIR
ncbi:neuronal acetylcholine receptor subunit alpha-10-like [Oratosquilla oratoria]|uniref:neuronal acetylcholine receptor subunit alpha-10-like n=1 Tax=Oratosquilla oratoria TaxID=337810 RepID=UPI003F76AE18